MKKKEKNKSTARSPGATCACVPRGTAGCMSRMVTPSIILCHNMVQRRQSNGFHADVLYSNWTVDNIIYTFGWNWNFTFRKILFKHGGLAFGFILFSFIRFALLFSSPVLSCIPVPFINFSGPLRIKLKLCWDKEIYSVYIFVKQLLKTFKITFFFFL